MSGDTEGAVEGGSGLTLDDVLKGLGVQSEALMEILELLTALLMVVLFAIGVFDLGLKLYQLVASGKFTDPDAILKLIDTALLLLIIVEIYRTVISYVEDLNILPIVINVGLIAMARKIISFRTGKYGTKEEALLAAGAYGFLMLILVASFYLMHRSQQRSDFDIYSVGDDH